MELASLLDIRPGVTAVIGGGGKTTLLRTFGGELAADGKHVLVCTTTKILPFPDLPCARTSAELEMLREKHRLVCAGTPVPGTEKLTAPELSMAQLAAMFDYVLAEADGAARRPLKAHAPHEPVIPPQSNQTILVLGAEGLGRTVAQAAHRPALYARLAGAEEGSVVTPALAARMLRAEGLHDRVFVNQADDWERWADAVRALAAELDCPVAAGSLRRGVWRRVQ